MRKLLGNVGLKVTHYLLLLHDALRSGRLAFNRRPRGPVVIHDPCLLARELGVVEEPRRLLEAAGYEVVNPRRHGRLTFCCGGPIESMAPGLALEIGAERLRELAAHGDRVVVLCPICLTNLRAAARKKGISVRVDDISLYLSEALA